MDCKSGGSGSISGLFHTNKKDSIIRPFGYKKYINKQKINKVKSKYQLFSQTDISTNDTSNINKNDTCLTSNKMKLKSKLVTGLAGILLTCATAFNSNAQDLHWRRPYTDVFSQPNDTNLIWYGSGDVNSDNVVDWDDYNAMNTIQNDMSDVDGNGIPSEQNDTAKLGQFLRNEIPYLPSDFVSSDSTEKRDWITKMLAIDSTESTSFPPNACGAYAGRLHYHFHGGDPNEFADSTNSVYIVDKFKLDYVNRFNIPVYEVRTSDHSINGIFYGQDSPLDFKYFLIEPQNDNIYEITGGYIGGGSFLNNNITFYDTYYSQNSNHSVSGDFISFDIDLEGNASVSYIEP